MSERYTANATGTAKIAEQLLPLTDEEQSLLDFYGEVRALEKLAAQAASDAAKAVLAAADEEYQRRTARENGDDEELATIRESGGADHESNDVKQTKQKRKKAVGTSTGTKKNGNRGESEMSGAEDDSESETEAKTEKKRKLELKLNKLRDDVKEGLEEEQKNEETFKQQEDHREALLKSSSASQLQTGTLRRKRRDLDSYQDEDPSKLISLMDHTSTPPHDFSKSLKMNRVSGSLLFPDMLPGHTPSPTDSTWTPPEDSNAPDEGCLEFELPEFDPNEAAEGNGYNTLAVKFHAPKDSKRFSINIAAPDHDNYYSVLFHFNPRQFEKGGQVFINDKQTGTWGQAIKIPLSTFPLMFGEISTTLIVQINGDGFDVFINNEHCARLEHRVPLPSESGPLVLQFPSTDDYGRKSICAFLNESVLCFTSMLNNSTFIFFCIRH